MYQHRAGVAQLVERQPSKLHVASSTLVSRSIEAKICSYSSVVEHSLGKGEVSSSNLDKSSRLQFSDFYHKVLNKAGFLVCFSSIQGVYFLGDKSILAILELCRRKRGKSHG